MERWSAVVTIADSGDGNTIIGLCAEPAAAPDFPNDLWDDLPALTAALQGVTNNSEAAPGGGGTPRQPPAPPFDRWGLPRGVCFGTILEAVAWLRWTGRR
jgi:hypothetical protein